MIPVGPLFNHPHTYKPFSSSIGSPDVSLRTRPLIFGTTPAKKIIIIILALSLVVDIEPLLARSLFSNIPEIGNILSQIKTSMEPGD